MPSVFASTKSLPSDSSLSTPSPRKNKSFLSTGVSLPTLISIPALGTPLQELLALPLKSVAGLLLLSQHHLHQHLLPPSSHSVQIPVPSGFIPPLKIRFLRRSKASMIALSSISNSLLPSLMRSILSAQTVNCVAGT